MAEEKSDSTNQSDYYYQAVKIKERLENVSPTICLAKWLQVSIHLTTGRTQSCYHPPTHKIDLEEIRKNPRALHNTKQKKQERKLMKEGQRPHGCEYCWQVEDTAGDHISDRFFRSGEPWAREFFDEVVEKPFDYDVNPRYVEVNFNHTCNFKCSYCSPHISSTWAEEAKKHGPFPTINPHNDISYFQNAELMPLVSKDENPYLQAFWEWWPTLYPDLRVFRMTGGEPLLDKNTYRVLDWINTNPRPDLELAITSNLCPPSDLMEKFIEKIKPVVMDRKVKRFSLFPSIDSWGAQAEYIRNGLNFELFWKNANTYLTEVPRGIITFIVTMNALSAPGLKDLLAGFIELQKKYNSKYHRIFFDTPFLQHPAWMSLQLLTPELKKHVEDALSYMEQNPEVVGEFYGFRDFQISRMRRVVAWMNQELPPEQIRRGRADHYLFFQEHDRRRGTNYGNTFPQYASFWEICKQAAGDEAKSL